MFDIQPDYSLVGTHQGGGIHLTCVVGGPAVEEFRERVDVEMREPHNVGEWGKLDTNPVEVRITGTWIWWPEWPPHMIAVEEMELLGEDGQSLAADVNVVRAIAG